MIHTFQMNFALTEEDLHTLEDTVGGSYKQVNDYIQMNYGEYFNDAFTVQVMRHTGKIHLSVVVDVILLLKKSDIRESDYSEVKQRIMELLMLLLGHAPYDDHTLVRIDYRHDVIMPNKHLRKLYFYLITKHIDRYRFQQKYKGKKNTSGKFEKYETTIYHSSGSIVTTAYDKEAEREAKECETQLYEKDVIRFEVRLMYRHLYYKASARCPNPISMHLSNYFKQERFTDYIKNNLLVIYPKGDYYKYSEAERIIHSSSLNTSDKSLLKEVLLKTSSHSLSTPKKRVSPYKYKKAMRLLQNLGINPVCIPKNYLKAPKQFENPLNSFFTKFK